MSQHDEPTRRDEELPDTGGHRNREQRWRRRVALASGTLLVLGLLAVPVLALDNGDSDVTASPRDQGGAPLTTTSVPTANVPTAKTAPGISADQRDDARAPAQDTTMPTNPDGVSSASVTTTTAFVCRNSHEPRCGEFRWDPEPDPNEPMTISVKMEPAVPRAGEEVLFTVTIEDPDAPIRSGSCSEEVRFGDEKGFISCHADTLCEQRYGAWDPPPKEPDRLVREYRHVYEESGTYIASFSYKSGDACDDPYASEGTEEVEVVVAPASGV